MLLDEFDIALFAFIFSFDHIGGYIFDAVQEKQNSCHSSTEVLLFQHVCPQVVILDHSNIALFALLHSSAEVFLFIDILEV